MERKIAIYLPRLSPITHPSPDQNLQKQANKQKYLKEEIKEEKYFNA